MFKFKHVIFLTLLVIGMIIIQYNIHHLKIWPTLHSPTTQSVKPNSTIVPNGFSVLQNKHMDCNSLHPEMSAEEAQEARVLLDSIVWPVPQYLSRRPYFNETTDPAHTKVTIRPAEGGREWRVGDELEAVVQMFDFRGRPKQYGGDVLFARLHNLKLEANVVGHVVDHLNGSYSLFFPLLWEGSAELGVMLVHPSEAVAVLSRLLKELPHRVLYQSTFSSGSISEKTYCNLCLPANQNQICDYTDLYTREPWYCYKPKGLSCEKRVFHMRAGSQKNTITKEELLLFQRGVNVKVHIRASASQRVNVLPGNKGTPAVKSNEKPEPTGYFYKNRWRNLGGDTVRYFDNATAMSQCLKNKMVYIYGDSTARQWFEYLNQVLPELKEINLHGPKLVGPYMAVDIKRNILVNYRCHGPPLSYTIVPISDLRYVANELDSLAGGKNTVVAISIWAHLAPFPAEVYIKRLQNIRKAILRLQKRGPGTTVVIRTGNPRGLDHETLDHSLNFSDWFTMLRGKVLRAMFKGLNVKFVDAWEMTKAHHLPHDIHPARPVVKNMIDIFLSHIC